MKSKNARVWQKPLAGLISAGLLLMLERIPETVDDLLSDDMIKWSDNAETDVWYYLDVQEATNSHLADYKNMRVEGMDFYYEYWVEIIDNRDWTELER